MLTTFCITILKRIFKNLGALFHLVIFLMYTLSYGKNFRSPATDIVMVLELVEHSLSPKPLELQAFIER
jgi:hypothetical protein